MKSLPIAAALSLTLGTAAIGAEMTLPWPVSNNAVAVAQGPDGPTLYSFLGMGAGKTFRDILPLAAACPLKKGHCTALPAPPLPNGRIAGTAATVGGKIYLFGGYSVGEDGTEVSNPEALAFDPKSGQWEAKAPIPVPVDDSVSVTFQDRYVYLISGWHEDRNIANVQVFDTQENKWFDASPFPGTPVFGQAGAISGNKMVIADGVAVLGKKPDGHNLYGLVNEAWEGAIDAADPAHIVWRRLPPHPGKPAYRMAAVGSGNQALFAGGSENPYNYNGLGYDGAPSKPSARLFAYDVVAGQWIEFPNKKLASMDHRGMLAAGGKLYILGGMTGAQKVTDRIQVLDAPR